MSVALISFGHVLTVVTQEHLVGIDIRTDFQLCCGILAGIIVAQGGTITAAIDGTTNVYGVVFFTGDTDRHRLGIGTEGVQGLCR